MSAQRNPAVPGLGLSLGFTVTYLGLVVVLPTAVLLLRASEIGLRGFVEAVTAPRTLAAYRLSLVAAFVAASINAVFGLLLAWVLQRYRFPGRRLIDGLIDLPFALPTAIAGIALTTVYSSSGWVGRPLSVAGIHVAYTPIGIVVALTFVGLPFVVRTVQPVLRALPASMEEAAASLGAGRATIFARIVLPNLLPALATGFTLALARGLGEYGSVIFIAGNMPLRSEITPLLIMIKLEEFDYAGATAVAVVFLAVSFAVLLTINFLSARAARRSLRWS